MYTFLDRIFLPCKEAFVPYVVQPDIVNGPWIAGGAPRFWMLGEAVPSDYDVYCSSEFQFQELRKRLEQYNFKAEYDTTNAVTFKLNHDQLSKEQYSIQIIKREFFQNAFHVLDSFDFAHCMLVTDGVEVHGHPQWNSDNLQIINLKEDSFIKRFLKYYAYGYDPMPGQLEDLAKKDLNFEFNPNDEYA